MYGTYKNFGYLEYRPDNFCDSQKYPLIIHLHGAGYRGTNPEALNDYPILRYARSVKDFPFVVIMPQCFDDTWYDIFEQLKDFVRYACALPYIDTDRIYISGVSMGAYGAWQIVMSLNELFSAGLFCCGGGMVWNTKRVKCPVWAFHGELDDAVYCDESRRLVDRINFYGGDARLTVYPGVWHACWDQTYLNPEVYEWLLSHKKENK